MFVAGLPALRPATLAETHLRTISDEAVAEAAKHQHARAQVVVPEDSRYHDGGR